MSGPWKRIVAQELAALLVLGDSQLQRLTVLETDLEVLDALALKKSISCLLDITDLDLHGTEESWLRINIFLETFGKASGKLETDWGWINTQGK